MTGDNAFVFCAGFLLVIGVWLSVELAAGWNYGFAMAAAWFAALTMKWFRDDTSDERDHWTTYASACAAGFYLGLALLW